MCWCIKFVWSVYSAFSFSVECRCHDVVPLCILRSYFCFLLRGLDAYHFQSTCLPFVWPDHTSPLLFSIPSNIFSCEYLILRSFLFCGDIQTSNRCTHSSCAKQINKWKVDNEFAFMLTTTSGVSQAFDLTPFSIYSCFLHSSPCSQLCVCQFLTTSLCARVWLWKSASSAFLCHN